MRVLVFLSYYLPGFKGGGPIRTIENMVDAFRGVIDFYIVTRDRDLGSDAAYNNIEYNKWNKINNAFVRYMPLKSYRYNILRAILFKDDYCILYLNSFFSFFDSIFPLIIIRFSRSFNKKIILAPRGEFSEGALGINKIKKELFIKISKILSLHRRIVWQASSEKEERDIKKIYNSANVVVAPDLIFNFPVDYFDNQLKMIADRPIDECYIKAVFISRISPKKNLLFLLEVLSDVKANVSLEIFGPKEDEQYWDVCERKIKSLPSNIQCHYKGTLYPNEVTDRLVKYDLFLFPTFGENFGHVIFESLVSGTPVFISDQTPWEADLNGSVKVIPLAEKQNWINSIESFACDKTACIYSLKKGALDYAWKFVTDDVSKKMNLKLFYS